MALAASSIAVTMFANFESVERTIRTVLRGSKSWSWIRVKQ